MNLSIMEIKLKRIRTLNGGITRKVIELHAKGYHFDYLLLADQQLLCIQNNQDIPVKAVHIQVIDQGYDQLSRGFKYIHAIDTGNGERGLMVTDAIITNYATF